MSKKAFIILGDCLYEQNNELIKPDEEIIMIEAYDLATNVRHHKQKIVFFFSAMHSHKDYLIQNNLTVHYHKYDTQNFIQALKKIIEQKNIQQLRMHEIEDKFFVKTINDFCKKNDLTIEFINKPGFLTSHQEFKEWLGNKHKPLMQQFYIWQRKRLKILLTKEQEPTGGKWSYDEDNRKKLPKNHLPPKIHKPKHTRHTKEAINLVDKEFENHPGNTQEFWLPTTHEQSKEWLQTFLEERLKHFGTYEDAIEKQQTFLYHSGLSALMNAGLLTPKEVVTQAITYAQKNAVAINNLEGFVRQIIGWREFIRGVYHHFDLEKNFFGHKKKLTKAWYEGTTGIKPLDDSIKKAQKYGYTHHIERLMIIGNCMLLARIDPQEVQRWFMELYVDSAHWVMVPNVYGMSQFADAGVFATKPYIAGSNYIKKMSHYPQDEWCETLDGLYWLFIHDNKEIFLQNHRMRMMVSLLDKMPEDKKTRLFKKAKAFIETNTC